MCALGLLRVAAGLRRRKRMAWVIAVAACVLIAVVDLVRVENRPVEGVLTIILLAILILARSEFQARPDPRNRRVAIRRGSTLSAVALGYGFVLINLSGHVPGSPTLLARAREVLLSFVGLGGTLRIVDGDFADAFHASLLAMGLLTAASTAVLLLRTSEPLPHLSQVDEERLRDLLARSGERDSLGYFALRRDKSVIWSPSGKAAITYRVVAGVALISGDPIGDPEAWPGAIEAYRQLVAKYGWTPAVMGCSELGAIVVRRELGLCVLGLGDEAVLDTTCFSLEGRAMRAVRQPHARVARAGYVASARRVREIGPAELAELRAAADAWRTDPVERGFSMALSRLGDPADGDCLVVTARRDGELRGLLHFAPWSPRKVSLDLMRRDPSSDNGLNEFMIAELMSAAPGLGIDEVSLNFAVFREALERGSRVGAGPISRLWRRFLLVASRWWQIDSLYRFNGKFHPEWRPRYFCYSSARDVPRIACAAMEAEAFIAWPRFMRYLVGRP
ncbi:MAG: lysyl-tRNA synthetase, class [Pseudonocardiales bacterium]|jgi:lysyl-tRNA synthetase class 2|nr:lysyl-tRNA synthetase, class [Pseudonocardiales bacterium]